MAFEAKLTGKEAGYPGLVTERSVLALTRSLTAFKEAADGVDALAAKAANLHHEIQEKEGQIKALNTEYAEKKRQFDVDLKLKMQDDQQKLVNELLAAQKKMGVLTEDWNNLQAKLKTLEADFTKDVQAAVGKEKGILEAQFKTEKALLDSQWIAKEAQNVAEIQSLKNQLATCQSHSDMLVKQLDAERAAGVDRVKGMAAPSFTVGGATR